MKKYMALAICFIIVLCLVGCKKSNDPETTSEAASAKADMSVSERENEVSHTAENSLTTVKAQTPATVKKAQTANNNKKTDPALLSFKKDLKDLGTDIGMAFIGYTDYTSTKSELMSLLKKSKTGNKYAFLSNASVVIMPGQELYAIVPVEDGGRITICSSEPNENGVYVDNKSNPVYAGKPDEIILLRCNVSEIYSNVLIISSNGRGVTTYRPSISLEDGHMAYMPGCFDFSDYNDYSFPSTLNKPDKHVLEIMKDTLKNYSEIKDALANGMDLVYTGKIQEIDGGPFMIFATCTEVNKNKIVKHFYAIKENLVYARDMKSGDWRVLSP